MKPTHRRHSGKGAFDLIEEAVHLLRTAPVATLAGYYLGGIPFVLGLLYFWADMSRSPFAHQHVAEASLGLAALFLWLKFCQAAFARRLRAQIAGAPPPRWGWRQGGRVFLTQAIVQPSGLFVLPLALLPVLPLAWVYAFYQNATALADGEPGETTKLVKASWSQATLWPMQNHFILAILSGFGFCVFLNWTVVCLAAPQLVKMFFGLESAFTRSPLAMLNTTFFAAICGLTYLCVDPILKAVYALRCFYGESLQSGEDLKAELKPFAVAVQKAAAVMVMVLTTGLAFCFLAVFGGRAESRSDGLQVAVGFNPRTERPSAPRRGATFERSFLMSLTERAPVQASLRDARRGGSGPWTEVHGYLHPVAPRLLALSAQATPQELADEAVRAPTASPASPTAPPAGTPALPPGVSPPELDRAINETIHESKYTWRMPREKIVEPEAEQGVIGKFLEKIGTMLRRWVKAAWDWLTDFLDKLFRRKHTGSDPDGSGYGWIMVQELLLYGLVAAAIIALAWLIYRIWRGRRRAAAPVASEAIAPAPDLRDENVGADQLPEDGWTRLGRELLARGEFRLAMRAFYLASLAHLAARNLISLARCKSNREYERELRRRGHSFPDLLSVFDENLLALERIWYGTHEVNLEAVNQFAANVERIKGAG